MRNSSGVRLCSPPELKYGKVLSKFIPLLLLHLFVLFVLSPSRGLFFTTLVPSLLLVFSVTLLLSISPVAHLRIDFAPHSFSTYSLDQAIQIKRTQNIKSIHLSNLQIHHQQTIANKGSQPRKSNISQAAYIFQYVQQACHRVGCSLGCRRSSRASQAPYSWPQEWDSHPESFSRSGRTQQRRCSISYWHRRVVSSQHWRLSSSSHYWGSAYLYDY